jgi:ABC-type uncharacterized transport system substrate-binding protein
MRCLQSEQQEDMKRPKYNLIFFFFDGGEKEKKKKRKQKKRTKWEMTSVARFSYFTSMAKKGKKRIIRCFW